jgi:hypothetical protein
LKFIVEAIASALTTVITRDGRAGDGGIALPSKGS